MAITMRGKKVNEETHENGNAMFLRIPRRFLRNAWPNRSTVRDLARTWTVAWAYNIKG